MQTIPFRNLLFTALLLPFFGKAADNPFSRFSPKWDDPAFKKAKPTYGRDISKADLELAHMINLVRMDPLLFGNSVLMPHARKSGKTREAKRFMDRAATAKRLNPVTVTLYHRYKARILLDSLAGNGLDTRYAGGGTSEGTGSARLAWKRTVAGGTFEILMEMLLASDAHSAPSIEAMLGEAETGGVVTRKSQGGGFETALVMDAMPDSVAKWLSVPDMCDDAKLEEKRFLEYCRDGTDAIMNRMRVEFEEPEGVAVRVVDDAGLKKIIDSLYENKVSHGKRDLYYEHEIGDSAFSVLKRDPAKDRGFPGGPRSWGSATNFWHHPKKSLYAFSIRRQLKPCGGILEVEYKYVEVIAPEFRYHPDSVGRMDPSELDFTRAEFLMSLVKGEDAEKLASELTDPFETEVEKVWAIFHWLYGNIEYDSKGLEDGTVSHKVEDVLKRRKAVCQGFAETFKRLCDFSGIRTKSISGHASGSSMLNHQWNAVNIDGKWYLVDVTWGPAYFLMAPEEFLKNHLPRDNSYTLLPKYVFWETWSDDYHNKYQVE